jgi:long-subunit fatty acid transport protein
MIFIITCIHVGMKVFEQKIDVRRMSFERACAWRVNEGVSGSV